MNIFLSYLKFLIKSKNEHSVHSPFVFSLITKALYEKKVDQNLWFKYLSLKSELLKNNSSIEVEDFGAGSKKLKSNKRKVSDIVKKAGISKKRARVLYQITYYLKPKSILEIGTSVGLSTSVLSLAQPSSKIITLEGCKNTLGIAKKIFNSYSLKNINTIHGKFDTTLPKILQNNSFDFVFVDGNHTKEATIRYFELLLKSIHNDSCLIFDDIYWSKGMEEAWNYIYQHPKVTVSIDTFKWGIVFFRKEQPKEHFIIRV